MSFDFGEKQDADPTADFLARERAAAGALQGDADLFGGSAAGGSNSMSALQGQTGAGDTDFQASAANFPSLDGEEDGFGSGQPAAAAPASGLDDDDLLGGGGGGASSAAPVDADRDQFERNFPELDDSVLESEPSAAPASVR